LGGKLTAWVVGVRRWVRNPVRAVLLLGAVAASMVLIATETYLIDLRRHELRHAAGEGKSISRIIGDQTSRALQGVALVVGGVAERIDNLGQGQFAASDFLVHTMLKSRIEGMPHIGALFLVDAEGKVVNASTGFPVPPLTVSDRDYFQFHRTKSSGQVFFGPPLITRLGGEWTVHMSRRVERRDGSFAGVVVAELSLSYFEQLHDLDLEYISPIALYLSDGRLLTRIPRNVEMFGRTFPLPPPSPGGTESLRSERVEGDSPGVVIYRDISGFPLTLAVSILDAAALRSWRQNANTLHIGAGMMAAFIVLITLMLIHELMRQQVLAANLTQTDKTLRALIDTAMDAIVTVDMDQRIVLFNPAAEKMFACNVAEAMGTSFDRFMPMHYRDERNQQLASFHDSWRAPPKMDSEVVALRADGEKFPVEFTVSQVTVAGRTLFTAVLRDISERRRAEAAIKSTSAELRRLSESLIMVREAERTRIARELHDELGQQLMRISLDLSTIEVRLHSSQPEIVDKFRIVTGLLAETVASVRRITTELRPPLLDNLGLVAAAEWLFTDFSQRSGVAVEADIDPAVDECETDVATTIYRILQEALTNVGRHAAASRVCVTLHVDDDAFRLAIEDNGRGMHSPSAQIVCAGNGLVGMRERVLMFAGRIDVENSAMGGVRIGVHLPRNRRSQDILPDIESAASHQPQEN